MRYCEQTSRPRILIAPCGKSAVVILLGLTLLGGGRAIGDDKPDVKKPTEQQWIGTLGAGKVKLRVLVKLTPSDQGFRGNLVSLDQGASDIPMSDIVFNKNRLKFTVKNVKGKFDGRLNAKRTVARGTWTQLGRPQLLVLRRVEEMPDPADQHEAEEEWVGTLKAGAAKLRLLVQIKPADNGFRGHLVSLDQGNDEIPIDQVVRDNRRLKFRVQSIKGRFDGRLNAAGTEARGTWVQLGRKMTLVLRRQENAPGKEEYAKLAPFTGVRWKGLKPEVKVGEQWFTLVSLDGVAADDIVAFSRRTYKDKWQKRFEEDLVEVLSRMGHKPKETVRLVVSPVGSTKTRTLKDVPMTEANRRAIRAGSAATSAPQGETTADSLEELVAQLRSEKELVGLAAMIMVDGKIVDSAVDGERKLGSGIALEIGDRFHIGSVTKSITATMIARLIEQNTLKWDTTVGECLGASTTVHADWRDVTLQQLLTHTSGAPANFPTRYQFNHPPEGDERVRARMQAVTEVLKDAPATEPGSAYEYSNAGYTIAAVMAEQKTGTSWEDLVRKQVFGPLKFRQAGFGPPQGNDQPRGHKKLGAAKSAVGVKADNTPIIGPSGSVHMTLAELCEFGNEHLAGERGRGELLTEKTYQRLHTARLNNYACGWLVPQRSGWAEGRTLWHNGSNTMWYTLLVLVPERKAVIAVASNDGDIKSAEAAAIEIVSKFAK